jgi:lysophospholipase L1-like esterase
MLSVRVGLVAVVVVAAVTLSGCAVGRGRTSTGSRSSVHGSSTTTESASAKAYAAAVAALPRALWIGDSYTAGAGGTSTATGEAYRTSDALKWHVYLDAEGGTGFLENGHAANPRYRPVPDRLVHDKAEVSDPEVVVIDAGRDDLGFPAAKVRRAVVGYFRALARAFPSSPVVVIAPFLMKSKPTDYAAIRHLLAQQAERRGWAFVDPIADGWINKASAKLVTADGIHPDQQGYDYIVAHLAPAIEKALAAAHETVH